MPQKQNPVLSVLVRRAAICAPPLAGTLHTAAALAVDERPDGPWHAEWATLRTLSRYSVVAASQTTELVSGLQVNADRMRETADRARDALLAEQRSITKEDSDRAPENYLGASDLIIDAVLSRATQEDNR
jgi:3-carboxy-cis,cis-muconate cycloisomerase